MPGWTLNYEMFFYLVFALLIVFSPLVRVTLAVLVFVALAFAGWLLGDAVSDAVLRTYTSPRLLEFVIGMIIGYAYLRRAVLAPWLGWLLVGRACS